MADYDPAYSHGLKKPPRLDVSYLGNRRTTQDTIFHYAYNLTRVDLGPFDHDLPHFLPLINSFQITFEITHHLPASVTTDRCYVWTIQQTFDFSIHTLIKSKQHITRTVCKDYYGRL